VATDASDEDVDGVGVGHGVAGDVADFSGFEVAVDVEGEAEVGAGEAGEEAVVEHGLGAADDFLGGLADENEGAGPLVFEGGHGAGDADDAGDVDVVSAGVHDGDGFALWVGGGGGGGVGGVGLFLDGQGVEVGADEEGFAGAVFQDGDDAVDADFFGDFVVEGAELFGEAFGGFGFLEGELGVAVDGGVEGVEVGVVFVEEGLDLVFGWVGEGEEGECEEEDEEGFHGRRLS
jgi:hypothetical protein